MNFTKAIVGFVFVGLFASCTSSSDQKPKDNSSVPTENAAAPKAESPKKETSTANVLRAAMSSTDFSSMGYLLSKSKWAEMVTKEKVTFLCVSEKSLAFNQRQLMAELKRPENQDLLDEYLALHVLKGEIVLSKTDFTEVETLSGVKLKLDRDKRTIDGVEFLQNEIATDMGMIYELKDVLRYPEKELKARAGKRLPKSV
jgi:uncharacterized surface protein with fasciclin (FAS1) repeats